MSDSYKRLRTDYSPRDDHGRDRKSDRRNDDRSFANNNHRRERAQEDSRGELKKHESDRYTRHESRFRPGHDSRNDRDTHRHGDRDRKGRVSPRRDDRDHRGRYEDGRRDYRNRSESPRHEPSYIHRERDVDRERKIQTSKRSRTPPLAAGSVKFSVSEQGNRRDMNVDLPVASIEKPRRDGATQGNDDTGYNEEDDFTVEEDDMADMQRLMGFGGFSTTQNTKVEGNNIGAVRKEKKTEYRQYMNRVGGFNRPLSPSA